MVITVDTNFLIWGLRGVSSVGQEGMVPPAKEFFEWVVRSGHKLVLTSECVAEYLVGGTDESRKRQLSELRSRFMILTYDAKAAAIAAELRSDPDFIASLKGDELKTKVCIKSDIVIVATSRAYGDKGVDRIYSNDVGLRNVAMRCGIAASPLPTVEEMAPLPTPSKSLPEKRKEKSGNLFPDEDGESVEAAAPAASDLMPVSPSELEDPSPIASPPTASSPEDLGELVSNRETESETVGVQPQADAVAIPVTKEEQDEIPVVADVSEEKSPETPTPILDAVVAPPSLSTSITALATPAIEPVITVQPSEQKPSGDSVPQMSVEPKSA